MGIRSLVLVCLSIAVVCVLSGVVFADGNELFYDDFSTNPEETWTQLSNNEGEEWIWNESAQTWSLHVDHPVDNLQVAGDESWQDYAVEVKVMSSMGHRWGILFRGSYLDDGFAGLVLWADDMMVALEDYPVWNHFGELKKPITRDEAGKPSLAFKADTWYVIRIEVRGQNAKVLLNGEDMGSIEFEGFEKGMIGLYSFVEGSNTFDYVKVTGL